MKSKALISKCLRRGVLPFLPARQRLPFSLWIHLHFEDAEPELVHLSKLIPKRGIAIDVGANVGFWALSLVPYCDKVYAFEINETVSRDLIACGIPNIEINNVGLSNHPGTATLYIPIHPNGFEMDGWASLQIGNYPGITKHCEKQVQLKTLDSFAIKNCSFLKIDIEGHELEMLKGAIQTLKKSRPVVLVEIKEHNLEEVRLFFSQIGYKEESFLALANVVGSFENHIFLPLNYEYPS
jgi:FkbM family methyltransferase